MCTEFKKRFSPHVSSTLAPPNFPSDYMPKEAPKEEGAAAVPSKVKLNFFLPHEQQMKAKEVRKPGECACRLGGGACVLLMLLAELRQACFGELVSTLCSQHIVLCSFSSSARACLWKTHL